MIDKFDTGQRVIYTRETWRHVVFCQYSHAPYNDKAWVWFISRGMRTPQLIDTCDLAPYKHRERA